MSEENRSCFSAIKFKSKVITFCAGIIIGSLGSLIWQELLFPNNFINHQIVKNQALEILQTETNEKLLKYIEGKWRSSIGDLIVNINDSDINGSFVVIENLIIKPKRQEKYKVISIEKVDGLFGIVQLTVCSFNKECVNNIENLIPIQINKVFGVQKTITMSYNHSFSYCITEYCTRAFKEVEE